MSSTDHDAQEMLISSFRSQIQDLFSQVSQLNNKLVQSYDRVSDLEDSLHVTKSNLQLSNQKITHLELEKSQHLSQLTSGSLVEKTHVTAELTRLMERATEEAAQRGQAVNAKEKIERELEELSASLFGEANGMVEEARAARYRSEKKVEEAEGRLREAEEAVRLMQGQMQELIQERTQAETEQRPPNVQPEKILIRGHLAYREFLSFLAHLRQLRISMPSPAMSTLLQLPFLARLLTEDSEPTLRLDLAPSLNWLSRRSVLAAVHSGQLNVEPTSLLTLLTESSNSSAATSFEDFDVNIPCALCGCSVFPSENDNILTTTSTLEQSSTPGLASHTRWSGSFFRKPSIPLARGLSATNSNAPSSNTSPTFNVNVTPQTQVYIFRLASPPSSASAALGITSLSLPLSKPPTQTVSPSASGSSTPNRSSTQSNPSSSLATITLPTPSPQPATLYPLCTSGWCLARLRTTCTLWSFVRTGIVEKIWEEEVVLPPSVDVSSAPTTNILGESSITNNSGGKALPPPLPPRRRGLWNFASALGERAASWGEGVGKERGTSKGGPPLPPPASEKPVNDHDTSRGATLPDDKVGSEKDQKVRRKPVSVRLSETTAEAITQPPPPLPKRSENRTLPSHRNENDDDDESPPATMESNNHLPADDGGIMTEPPNAEVETPLKTTTTTTTPSSPNSVNKAPPTPPRSPVRSSTGNSPTAVKTSAGGGGHHTKSPSLLQAVATPLPESRAATPVSVSVVVGSSSPSKSPGATLTTTTTTPSRSGSLRSKTPAAKVALTHMRSSSSLSRAAENVSVPASRSAATPAVADAKKVSSLLNGPSSIPSSRTSSPALSASGVPPPPVPRRAAGRSINRGVNVSLDNAKMERKAIEVDKKRGHSRIGEGLADGEKEKVKEKVGEGEEGEEEGSKLKDQESGDPVGSGENTTTAEIKTQVVVELDSITSSSPLSSSEPTTTAALEREEPPPPPASVLNVEPFASEQAEVSAAADNTITTPTTPTKEPIDAIQYVVGNSTWEEKTWKELVRIREDMFWARIGTRG